MADPFSRSYRSFSGVDIRATFGTKLIGTLQGVSFTVTREKAPQYVMGKKDPISFSRGKRGIAGSLIFLMFDRTNLVNDMGTAFFANANDIRRNGNNPERASTLELPQTPVVEDFQLTRGGLVAAEPWYHDQLPPFTIVLTAATEYGQVCRMAIHNVEILNAGSGISIDDITTDENMTFVATDITPWRPIEKANSFTSGIDLGTLGPRQ